MPVVIRLRVVSLPAFCNSMKKRSICIWVSVSPSTSAVSQHAHEVVARLGPPLLAEPVGVHEHRGRGLGALFDGHRLVEAERQLGPVEHLGAVVLGHADEIGDDVQREPERDVGDEVAVVGLPERVHDAIDTRAHPILELRDAPRREAPVDQLPQLRVHRRVLADEQLGHLVGHLGVDERMSARC